MQGLKSYCWQLEPFGWPCLTQSEWASWIQVAAAIVGIALALYIPVRMKRLDDLERMRSVVARLAVLKAFGSTLCGAVQSSAKIESVPRVDVETARSACDALIKDVNTDAVFLKPLGEAIETSRAMLQIWESIASGFVEPRREWNAVQKHYADLSSAHQQAHDLLEKWGSKHRLALAFHG
jgi:hypothetical protein